MVINNLVLELNRNSWVIKTRIILGEFAVGLAVSFLALFLLEIIRPGMVSLYIDLNLLFVVSLITWLLGNKAESRKISWYASWVFFAILVVLFILNLIS